VSFVGQLESDVVPYVRCFRREFANEEEQISGKWVADGCKLRMGANEWAGGERQSTSRSEQNHGECWKVG
jgi:hypothetical protein